MRKSALRVAAGAAFIAAPGFAIAMTLFQRMSDALSPDAVDRGLSVLAQHQMLVLTCQQLFGVCDIALIVFLFGLALLPPPQQRALPALGAFMFSLAFAADILVVAILVSVTDFVAPHAAADPAMHAAGIATMGVATSLDVRETYFWMIGSLLLGVSAWRHRQWPRWLAALAILNGLLSVPSLPAFPGAQFIENGVFVVWVFGMGLVLWQRAAIDEDGDHAAAGR